MEAIVNWVIIGMGLVATWYQWQAYRILKSPAFIVLMLAMVYLVIYRTALPYYPSITGYGLVLPFYIMAVIHGMLITASLRGVLHEIKNKDTELDAGERKWWYHVDAAVVVVVVVAAVVVLVIDAMMAL